VRAFLARSHDLALPSARAVSPAAAFRQAIPAEVLNPKTALFFLASLPQFVQPARGSALAQLAELGLVFVAMSAVYATLTALAAGSLGRWLLRHHGVGRWRGKAVGTVYVALGLRLVLARQ
jgi:threonine/homoserine/homoserine lactone efflux protein